MMKLATRAALAVVMSAALSTALAAPVLQSTAPQFNNYSFGAGNDFTVALGTGLGDVTAALWAVDLVLPSPFANASTSACEASDFAGFVFGSIALVQRGTCTFDVKVALAQAAGAVGVLLFNEGNPGRLEAIDVSTMPPPTALVPVLFASFAVGGALANGVTSGSTGYTVRMKVAQEDLPLPEPGTLALLGLGLSGLAAARRRCQR